MKSSRYTFVLILSGLTVGWALFPASSAGTGAEAQVVGRVVTSSGARGMASPEAVDAAATMGLTLITITIHGQVAAAFTTDDPSTVVAPDWIHDMQVKLDAMATQINAERANNSLPPIERIGVEGDWGRLTWYGVRYVLAGRIVDVIADQLQDLQSAVEYDLEKETADHFVQLAREQTGNMSRLAGRRFADEAYREIESRIATHPDVPVFVDVVGHSRGGAVSGEVIRRLKAVLDRSGLVSTTGRIAAGQSLAATPPALSVTYLDAIDPTPDGVPTLAGNLLDDPIVTRTGPERISNFHAEKAFDPIIDSVSFFGSGFTEWLSSNGINPTDDELVPLGYPHGRSRPELFPNPPPFTDIDEEIAGTTHLSIESDFTAMGDVAVGQTPASDFSFSATSYLGELIQDPLLALPREPAESGATWSTADLVYLNPPLKKSTVGERERSSATTVAALPEELVRDGDFFRSAALVENANVILNSFFFNYAISQAFGDIKGLIQRIDDENFPVDGVWERSGTGITIVEASGVPVARLTNGDVLSQDLFADSLDANRFLTTIEYDFSQSTGELTASLAGDRMQAFASALATDVGTNQLSTLRFLTRRRAEAPGPVVFDSINLLGQDTNIYSVSVVPQPLSLDVVGYVLGRTPPVPDDWDVNGDGTVDAADAVQAAKFGI